MMIEELAIDDRTKLYGLALHDAATFTSYNGSTFNAMRVPGGWVYITWDKAGHGAMAFVPYSDEFNPNTGATS